MPPTFIDAPIHVLAVLMGWMSSWPATLSGVVIGSLFTLIGITITNRNNIKNLYIQLNHDREQKNKERILSMRRDVYLEAAEAIAAAQSAIIGYGDLSAGHKHLMDRFSTKSDKIAKVHII
ncbi:MAG: hypothetical protein EPN76_05520 [Burkholderiaceae bacterium]|nr:MAG: hypothetical protein EPN76_05520 [Burkholderiaceae bacterium]